MPGRTSQKSAVEASTVKIERCVPPSPTPAREAREGEGSTVALVARAGLECAARICSSVLLVLLACAAQRASAALDALPVTEVAPGIFLHAGKQEDANADNLGDIANIGFVLGEKCVAVIDSGGSVVVGERLRLAVRKISHLPICYVINTHVHPDHIFGNAAFRDEKPLFVGHAKLPAAMAARGGNYRNALYRDLGPAVQASEIVPPTILVSGAEDLDLGARVLKLRAWPTAHTDNDLTVFDPQTRTLWLSDLLFVKRIPVVDGSLKGWLAAIEELKRYDAARVIAGHGDTGKNWREALAEQERYLLLLLDETRRAIKARRTLQQAVDEVGTSEKDKWILFGGFHKRNVTAAYAELEWED